MDMDDMQQKMNRLASFERVSRRDMIKRDINFLEDDPSAMTFARRAALHLMSRYNWYNPRLRLPNANNNNNEEDDDNHGIEVLSSFSYCSNAFVDGESDANTNNNDAAALQDCYIEMDDIPNGLHRNASFHDSVRRSPVRPERPSLAKAWAYFEHVTLPRYLDHSAGSTSVMEDKSNHEGGGNPDYGTTRSRLATAPNATTDATTDTTSLNSSVGKTSSFEKLKGRLSRLRIIARFEKRNHLLSNWADQQKQQQNLKSITAFPIQQRTAPPSTRSNTNFSNLFPFIDRFFNNNNFFSNNEGAILELAEPGENQYPTRLYSPLWTPMNQMGDFGLGVGLYFSALRSVTILAFLAGLINIPNMIYFASDGYNCGAGGQQQQQQQQETWSMDISLWGSAVCTSQAYVPCPTCTLDDFADAPHRIATSSSVYGSGNDLIFVMKNYCDGAKLPLASVNYATLLFVIYGMININRHLEEQEVEFDEDEQTAQDYSIVIKNPPPDATDPEEWKAFFDKKFGGGVHVTCCTVARDNPLLVRALVRRREILQMLKWKTQPGTPLDVPTLTAIAFEMRRHRSFLERMKSLAIPGVPELLQRLTSINAKIRKLSLRKYPATKVFVTFETEEAQRRILGHLSVGSRTVRRNDVMKLDNPEHLFRSALVLNVKEADEPSTVRWHDLSDRRWDRFLKMSMTAYAWACAMVMVAFVVRLCRHRSAKFAAYAIAFFNSAFPEYAKILVNFESHPSEGELQTSLYVKIAAFRWINTAIIVTMITPFTSTLSGGDDNLLNGIREIFVAEIVTSNLIKLVDPTGLVERHYFAPRASSQEEMNSHMRGEEWHLAERYTNMTKILFLTLWYCSIYPFGFFLCALALFINQYAERYSLMRTWRRAPRLGSYISSFSRRYFFPLAISAMAVACSYTWAGFPFDNLCENEEAGGNNDDDDALENYIGSWDISSVDGSRNVEVTVSEGDPSYRFCQQSLYWYGKGFDFPAIPYWQKEGDEWMTEEQEILTMVFGWTSFFLVIGVSLWIMKAAIRTIFFRSNTETCGDDQGIPFSDVAAISSYVPEVKSDLFSYPLLAVDTNDVDEELYEWKDPDKPYSYYDLTQDAMQLLEESMLPEDEVKALFSTMNHWPPNQDAPFVSSETQPAKGEIC